jgi:hypothetical protein
MTVFDAHRQAGLGTPVEAETGPNADAFKLATAATAGFIDRIDAIRSDPDLSDTGKAAAIAKEQAARAPGLADAERRLKKESADIQALEHEEKAFAGLISPAEDAATEVRAQGIRSAFAALPASGKLVAVRAGSLETIRALWHWPDLGGVPPIEPKLREVIEERLLSARDPERYGAITIRKADHARAKFALGQALGFVNRNRSPLAGLRERVEALNKAK